MNFFQLNFRRSMTMTLSGAHAPSHRRVSRLALAALLPALLAACASSSSSTSDDVGSYMVAPGKYRFYACPNLAQTLTALKVREAELAGLIAKAGPDTGGSIVSAVAYRPEYIQTRGNIIAVRKEAAVKECAPQVLEPPAAAKPAPVAVPARRKR